MTLPFGSLRRIYSRAFASTAGLLLLLVLLVSCGNSTPVTNTPPIPTPLQFTAIDLGLPPTALNSPVIGPLPDTTLMHVRLSFKLNQSQLNQLNAKKVHAGQSTDASKLANSLGVNDTTYQKIKAFLGVQDVSLSLSKLHTDLKVDGKASTFARLFQTHFVIHQLNGRRFYAPATPPKLPKFIADTLVAVSGLDSYSLPLQGRQFSQAHAFDASSTNNHAAINCNAPRQELFPIDVARAYGYGSFLQHGVLGQHMTINLVETDGIDAPDIRNYFQCVKFAGKLSLVNVDGAPTQIAGESLLDIEMIAGLAPDVNIVDYQTNGGSFVNVQDELQQIIDDNANNTGSGSIVSVSLGGPENYLSLNDVRAIDQRMQVLTSVEHMTVLVASGDCAAFIDHVYGSLSVSFPASDPNVVAVGGTELAVNGKGNRAQEISWSDGSDRSKCHNQWGSGGGNSNFFPRPSWQTGPGVDNPASRGFRQVPDVAAVADNLATYMGGQWGPTGGTSAATPIWAAGLALVNEALIQQTGLFFYGPDTPYQVASSNSGTRPFYDVTQGDNLFFPATPGWDYPTGLGTPNLVDYYQVLLEAAKQQ